MTRARATRKLRADYNQPAYLFDTVDLYVNIHDDHTDVRAVSNVRRAAQAPADATLHLDGRDMELRSVAVNGRLLDAEAYQLDDRALVLHDLPDTFELTVETGIDPDSNLSLEGLYRSGDILCTQCEATGFSRITYFPDRPDVMARYTTLIEAD